MKKAEQFLKDRLATRKENGLLRALKTSVFPIDFCSNDYLGYAGSAALKEAIKDQLSRFPDAKNGATGSRLLSGNHSFTEETEQFIATFHQAESGLIFNSGYDANIGLLSALPQRGDTIITDELIHASLIDGARLSHASRYTFKHNDLQQLEAKLKVAKGNVYVVIESVYSMDGDLAPLLAICELCTHYQAALIVDEAHAVGIFGTRGEGLVQALNLHHLIFARVVTFGKALGTHGAIVLGSQALRQYLINFARSFIYTTAAPTHNITAVKCAYEFLIKDNPSVLIRQKIERFHQLAARSGLSYEARPSPIQTIMCSGNKAAVKAATILQQAGLDVRPILSPTVPEGKERLRICLHIFNTDEEIKKLVDTLQLLSNK